MPCRFDASSNTDDDGGDDPLETLMWLGRFDFQSYRSLSPLGRLITRLARQAKRRKGA